MAVDPRHEYTTPEEGRWPKPHIVALGFDAEGERRYRERQEHAAVWYGIAAAAGGVSIVVIVWLSLAIALTGTAFP